MLRGPLLVLLAIEICLVACYKTGAPVSMCASMTPHHTGTIAKSSLSPYKINVTPSSTMESYLIKITGAPFAGFLLQARRNISKPEVTGAFIDFPENVKTLNCGGGINTAITHVDNSLKEDIEIEWEAPVDFSGEVTFIGTVVHNFTTFWTNVLSVPVNVVANPQGSSSKTPQAKAGIYDTLYDGCGVRRNCLGTPLGCIDQRSCNVLIAVGRVKNGHQFEMMALKSKYVAVGLSKDNAMGADHVLECAYENYKEGFEGVNAYRSYNIPNANTNQRLDTQSGLTLNEHKYDDGNVYCKVTLDTITHIGDSTFNLNDDKYFLLLAAGSATKEGSATYHDVARAVALDSRQISDVSPVIVHDEFYDGCDVDKNCFGYPDNCVGQQNCQMVVSVAVEGTKYTFKMKSKVGAYVAVGLSTDNKMGGDSVTECVHEQGNNVKVYRSWNKPGERANTRDQINQDGIQVIKTSYENGVIYCEYVHNISVVVMQQTFDLVKDKYFLLLASGSALKEKGVNYHDIAVSISGKKRSLSDVDAFTSTSKLFLRLHGSFMIAAWIGTASIGIVFARYFKQTWVESSLCAKDLWFAWHRFFMLITWCLTIVAFVLIFVEVEGWVGGNSQMHAILGCVTTLLCFLQPIGAAFRPHPTARNRPVFNWLHWLMGNAAHIFAIVTIFFAIPLAKAELPDWLDWVLLAFVALYVSVHLLLTIGGCISERKNVKRVNSFPMKDMNTSRSALNNIERKQDAPHSGFRKFILFIHIIGITAITAAIIAIIALAPIEAQWTSLQQKLM